MILGGFQKAFFVKLKKEELASIDRTQIMYLQVVHGLIDKSLSCFSAKHHKKSIDYLRTVIRIA